MSDRVVFIFVAAKQCGGCIRFNQNYWDNVEKELAKVNNLVVRKVEVNRPGDPLPVTEHKDLSKFVSWYPTFILVPQRSFAKDRLEGLVFNGVSNGDKWTLAPASQRSEINGDKVVEWVKDQMSNNPLFLQKKGVSFGPLAQKPILKGSGNYKFNEASSSSLIESSDSEDDDIYTITYCQKAFLPYT